MYSFSFAPIIALRDERNDDDDGVLYPGEEKGKRTRCSGAVRAEIRSVFLRSFNAENTHNVHTNIHALHTRTRTNKMTEKANSEPFFVVFYIYDGRSLAF